jgi:hypothetical protein
MRKKSFLALQTGGNIRGTIFDLDVNTCTYKTKQIGLCVCVFDRLLVITWGARTSNTCPALSTLL